MFKFLFMMFFLFILLLFLMGFSILRTIRNVFFGKGRNERRTESRQRQTGGRQNDYTRQQQQSNTPPPSARKKIFTQDEGEYVDYEEVK